MDPFGLERIRMSDPFSSGRSYGTFPSGRPTPRATILPNRERLWMEEEGEGEGIREVQNPWDTPDYWH